MNLCCSCRQPCGRQEVCLTCAVMLWPHRVVNEGAKRLKHTVLPVPEPPKEVPRHLIPLA